MRISKNNRIKKGQNTKFSMILLSFRPYCELTATGTKKTKENNHFEEQKCFYLETRIFVLLVLSSVNSTLEPITTKKTQRSFWVYDLNANGGLINKKFSQTLIQNTVMTLNK